MPEQTQCNEDIGPERYVLLDRLVDNTPIQLLHRTIAVWTQTAAKNGAKATIVCGDQHSTWTGSDAGGQSVLERRAEDFRFQNSPKNLTTRSTYLYTLEAGKFNQEPGSIRAAPRKID